MDEMISPQELYDMFSNYLRAPQNCAHTFTTAELCAIFDYAGDLDDSYVRIEAMLYCTRMYGNEPEIEERKAQLYGSIPGAAHRYIENNSKSNKFYDKLLMAQYDGDLENAINSMNVLLKSYDEFDDEMIVQMFYTARHRGMYSWLVENFDTLCDRSSNAILPYYEMGRMHAIAEEYKAASDCYEKCVAGDLFEPQFWGLLAKSSYYAGNYERARESADFGIAIDVYQNDCNLVSLLLDIDKAAEEGNAKSEYDVKQYIQAFEQNAADTFFAQNLCKYLYLSGENEQVCDVLDKLLEAIDYNPAAANLCPIFGTYFGLDRERSRYAFANLIGRNEMLDMDFVNGLIVTLGESGMCEEALFVYDTVSGEYRNHDMLGLEYVLYFSVLHKKYKFVVENFDVDKLISRKSVSIYKELYYYLVALVRVSRSKKAVQKAIDTIEAFMSSDLCEIELGRLEANRSIALAIDVSISHLFMASIMAQTLLLIKDAISQTNSLITLRNFDPFGLFD